MYLMTALKYFSCLDFNQDLSAEEEKQAFLKRQEQRRLKFVQQQQQQQSISQSINLKDCNNILPIRLIAVY